MGEIEILGKKDSYFEILGEIEILGKNDVSCIGLNNKQRLGRYAPRLRAVLWQLMVGGSRGHFRYSSFFSFLRAFSFVKGGLEECRAFEVPSTEPPSTTRTSDGSGLRPLFLLFFFVFFFLCTCLSLIVIVFFCVVHFYHLLPSFSFMVHWPMPGCIIIIIITISCCY